MVDENDDLAGCCVEQRIGESSRNTAEPPVGVEESCPRIEPDPHRSDYANSPVRWSVVVPTKVGWPHLESTLPPLMAALGAGDEVIVVGDGSDPGVRGEADPRCRTVVHSGTAGFAPVCNRGAAEARGRLLFFLNDDVVVIPGILETLERELSSPGIGAVGPDVLSEALGRSESGTSLFWHHGVLEARQHPLEGSGRVGVPYLCGAAMAIRRSDFDRLGGFDERLAPYFWEDTDLSLRTRALVGATAVVCGATVRHRHGGTVGSIPSRTRRTIYERNRLLVTWKHLEGMRWLAHLGWLPLRLVFSAVTDQTALVGFFRALGSLSSKRSGDARRG